MQVISENITADDGSKNIQLGLVSQYWTIVLQKCENEYPVKLFKLFWTYNRVSRNTQSWQCWHFRITPNENQMEINDSWIKFKMKFVMVHWIEIDAIDERKQFIFRFKWYKNANISNFNGKP